MRSFGYLLVVFSFIVLTGCATFREKLYHSAFTLLPEVTSEMNTAGYWISKIPDPDMLIMNNDQIKEFNSAAAAAVGHCDTIFTIEDSSSDMAKVDADIKNIINYFTSLRLYDNDGRGVPKEFYQDMTKECIAENTDDAKKYGFVFRTTGLRSMPSDKFVNDVRGELYFDTMQVCSLYPGERVRIIRTSRSGEWYYVATRFVNGWVKKRDIVNCSFDVMRNETLMRNIVVSSVKADIYSDPEMKKYLTFTRMGNTYRSAEVTESYVKIVIPAADESGEYRETYGYIERKSVNIGFLPYTQRNVIKTAFLHLNSPYGWGGMFGEADCSMFLNEVFAVFGIWIPRNSANQSLIGTPLLDLKNKSNESDKENQICLEGIPGVTFLRLPGHIVLYIGNNGGRVYVIHATWGYKEKLYGRDNLRAINRVTVSDLHIGEHSKKGSLLKRINRGVMIIPADRSEPDGK